MKITTDRKTGRKVVTGIGSKLRKSAHYPLQFGLMLANLINPHGEPTAAPDRV